MPDPPPLDALATEAERDPAALDYRALCQYLASDDYEEEQRAFDIRKTVI